MKKHEVTIHIAPDEFARVNRLLGIKSLQDMTDRELIEQGQIRFKTRKFIAPGLMMEVRSISTCVLGYTIIGTMSFGEVQTEAKKSRLKVILNLGILRWKLNLSYTL